MSLAKEEAIALSTNKVGTEHLLLALAKEDEGIAAEALRSLDISYDEIMAELKEVAAKKGTAAPADAAPASSASADVADAKTEDDAKPAGAADEASAALPDGDVADAKAAAAKPADGKAPTGKLAFTPQVITVMEKSFRHARENNQTYVSTEHLLLGIVDESSCMAMDILMRRFVRRLSGSPPRTRASAPWQVPRLDGLAPGCRSSRARPRTARARTDRCSSSSAPTSRSRRATASSIR